jgi:biotin carboxyl carrier protein
LLDGGRREEPIDVRAVGRGTYEVRLRGKVYVVDAFRHDFGTLSLIVDTSSYSAMLDWRASKVNVRLRHAVLPLELLDEKKLRMRRAAGTLTVDGKQTLTSPVPGRIVKVLCDLGDEVKAGQPVLVLEAMKMENELKSPKDGRVVELHVKAGQAVEGNAKLCAID